MPYFENAHNNPHRHWPCTEYPPRNTGTFLMPANPRKRNGILPRKRLQHIRFCARLCRAMWYCLRHRQKGDTIARSYRTLDRVATRGKTAIIRANNRIRKRYLHRTTTGQTEKIISDNKTLLLVALANPTREGKTIPELRRRCAPHTDAVCEALIKNNSTSAPRTESGIGDRRPRPHRASIWIYRSIQTHLWQTHSHLALP